MLPPEDRLTICVAHPAYQVKTVLDAAHPGLHVHEARTPAEFERLIAEADVVLVSGLWRNDLLARAPKLQFIQSISAGVNQYDPAALRAHGVRLASAQGANARAVAHHAMALILAVARRLPEARDNQARRHWRPMMGEFALREDELTGKTLLVVGLGGIGGRLARLARAFEMTVIGVRQDPAKGADGADAVHAMADLPTLLPEADYVAPHLPADAETQGLADAAFFARMKPVRGPGERGPRRSAWWRPDLIAALAAGGSAEPHSTSRCRSRCRRTLAAVGMPGVFITSHLGGETRSYEANVVEILLDNLGRLWRGGRLRCEQVVVRRSRLLRAHHHAGQLAGIQASGTRVFAAPAETSAAAPDTARCRRTGGGRQRHRGRRAAAPAPPPAPLPPRRAPGPGFGTRRPARPKPPACTGAPNDRGRADGGGRGSHAPAGRKGGQGHTRRSGRSRTARLADVGAGAAGRPAPAA